MVGDRLSEQPGLGQDVAVQQLLGAGPGLGLDSVGVGVQGEEVIGVPDGDDHLAQHVVDAGVVEA